MDRAKEMIVFSARETVKVLRDVTEAEDGRLSIKYCPCDSALLSGFVMLGISLLDKN